MTIRRGERWGSDVRRPDDLLVCSGDRELASAIASGEIRPLGVAHGDLHRSLGSPPPRTDMQAVPIDVLDVDVDGVAHVAVAHVVARRSWWRGPIVAVMNVDHLARWNVAPRAHPNDGRFDVVEVAAEMPMRQRWMARTRLAGGTHVPHPMIATRTAREAHWRFAAGLRVRIDGRSVGSVRELSVRIRPDAATIHV